MRSPRFWLAGLAVLSLVAAGCKDDPPEPKEVGDVAAARSAEAVRGVTASLRAMGAFSSTGGLQEALATFGKGFDGIPMPVIDGEGCPEDVVCAGSDGLVTFPSAPSEADADQVATQLEKYLRERVFTKDNVESSDGDTTVFRLKGESVCTDGTEAAPTACVSLVNQLELRILATRLDDDGMELTVLLGSKRSAPLSFRFLKKDIAMVVDLGALKTALVEFAPEAADLLPTVMVGQVEFKVTKEGEQHWILSASILQALGLELPVSENGVFSFSSAKASPLVALEADGAAKRARFSMNLNTTQVRLPYTGTATSLKGKDYTLSLSGLSYAYEVTEGQKSFSITHVGLGDGQSFLSLGADKLVTVDLNGQSGRHFDVTLAVGADGVPVVSVAPEFDLVARFFLAPLKAEAGSEIPAAYEDATYRVRLSGGANGPSLRPVAANASTGFEGGMQVVTGELQLIAGDAQVSVAAGQCLVGREAAEGSGSLLSYLQAGACQ